MKIRRSISRSLSAISMALVISLGFVTDTTKVLAIPDLMFYSGNRITHYDPDETCITSGSTGTHSLKGNSNAEKIWNFLVGNDGNLTSDQKLTAEQAAGVMGNIRQEAGPDYAPDVNENGGGGYGIVQWTGTRRTALEAAARKKGVKVSDLSFQLMYLYEETLARPAKGGGGNEWTVLKTKTTIEDALVFWHDSFERSKDTPSFVINTRGGYARDAYNSFSGKTSSGGNSSDVCVNADGNFAQTVLAYAWPDYHAKPYVQKKPEYEAAVKKAQSENKYTGDTCYGGGVDCGAFVTLLINNSGFDPSYNSNGKGGNTSAQAAWAKKNWQTLGNGGSIDTGTLKAGDVAISGDHTFVYVGDIPGLNSPNHIASASRCERAPMAGTESLTDNTFTWYRKK